MQTESAERPVPEEFPTAVVPPPLPPTLNPQPQTNDRPPRSTAWVIGVAVGLTLLIVATAGAFFLTYQHQASVISHVKSDRSKLAQDLSGTRTQLEAKSSALKASETKLSAANKKLTATRKSLTTTTADLQAAKSASTAQYSAGFDAGSGSTNVTYNEGWDAGYNSGWDYGYNTCHADYYC